MNRFKSCFRFSTRTLLVASLAFCLILGYRSLIHNQHNSGVKLLRKSGFDLWDEFEDPIGPNWLYLNGKSGVPNGGYFPRYFADFFCLKGYFQCWIHDQVDAKDKSWSHLSRLIHLRHIQIVNSSLPDDWGTDLGNCGYLDLVEIISCRIDKSDISEFGNLNVKQLEIYDADLSENTALLFSTLAKMRQLEKLTLSESGLTSQDFKVIQSLLPNCEVSSN